MALELKVGRSRRSRGRHPCAHHLGGRGLQLSGWPAGFDFERALQRTDSFGAFILRFIQVDGVNAHQRDLAAIAETTGWAPSSQVLSTPILAEVAAGEPRGLTGPSISIGPHLIGHAPRGLGDRLPAGAYAASLGMFGSIIGAKVFLPDERSALL